MTSKLRLVLSRGGLCAPLQKSDGFGLEPANELADCGDWGTWLVLGGGVDAIERCPVPGNGTDFVRSDGAIAHGPVRELTRVDNVLDQGPDAGVAVVTGDDSDTVSNDVVVTFKELQEPSVAIEQHPRKPEPGIVVTALRKEGGEVCFGEGVAGRTGINER